MTLDPDQRPVCPSCDELESFQFKETPAGVFSFVCQSCGYTLADQPAEAEVCDGNHVFDDPPCGSCQSIDAMNPGGGY